MTVDGDDCQPTCAAGLPAALFVSADMWRARTLPSCPVLAWPTIVYGGPTRCPLAPRNPHEVFEGYRRQRLITRDGEQQPKLTIEHGRKLHLTRQAMGEVTVVGGLLDPPIRPLVARLANLFDPKIAGIAPRQICYIESDGAAAHPVFQSHALLNHSPGCRPSLTKRARL